MIQRLELRTRSRSEFQEITPAVQERVKASGVQSGVCYVFVPHTTAAVTVNEHADPSLAEDIISQLDRLVPQAGHYRHLEGNSPGHIKACLVGSSQTLLVEGGKLVLGTWQGIFFCEFDGPRDRHVFIKIVPDNP